MGNKYEGRFQSESLQNPDLYELKAQVFHQIFEPYIDRFVEFGYPQSPQDELFGQILQRVREGNDAEWQTLADDFLGEIRLPRVFSGRNDFLDFFEQYLSENFEELLDYACFRVANHLITPLIQEILETYIQLLSTRDTSDEEDESLSLVGSFPIQEAERDSLPPNLSNGAISVHKIYDLLNQDEVSDIDRAMAFSELYRLVPGCSDYFYEFCINYFLLSGEVFAQKRDEAVSWYQEELTSLRQQILELENELEYQVGGDILDLEEDHQREKFSDAQHEAWLGIQQASGILDFVKDSQLFTSEQWLRSQKAQGLASDADPHFGSMTPIWGEDQRILRPFQRVRDILEEVEYDLGIFPLDEYGESDDFTDSDLR